MFIFKNQFLYFEENIKLKLKKKKKRKIILKFTEILGFRCINLV